MLDDLKTRPFASAMFPRRTWERGIELEYERLPAWFWLAGPNERAYALWVHVSAKHLASALDGLQIADGDPMAAHRDALADALWREAEAARKASDAL